ncbi:MAG: ABC transporter substrate-binding protein [Dehalococcoidia bacterium]
MLSGHNIQRSVIGVLAIALILVVACGSAAAPNAASSGEEAQPAALRMTPTAVPVRSAALSKGGPAAGTLRIALEEVGPPRWTPSTQRAPQNSINNTTFLESIWQKADDGALKGILLESWGLDATGTVWTLKFREGIPFHYDYGEFTARDFKWTMENSVAEGTTDSQAPNFQRQFVAEGGGMQLLDDYTLQVNTVEAAVDFTWQLTMAATPQMGKGIFSQAYWKDVGPEKASTQRAVGTGPWRSISHESGGIWEFEAMADHWRKTPEFARLEYRQIADESTRLANFLAGELDTAQLNTESIAELESRCSDCKFMATLGGQLFVNIHGQMYIDREDLPTPRNGDLPWVSASPDPDSPEWDRARKVRLAMNHAIDRDLLVETLFRGRGTPAHVYGWLGQESRMADLANLRYEYDPDLAKDLLAQAGYPGGFEIGLALSNPPNRVAIQAAEIVTAMWEEVGIRAYVTRQPMGQLPDRSWVGVYSGGRSPDPEPGSAFNVFRSASAVSYGLEHPIVEELLNSAVSKADEEARYEDYRKVSRFLFENAVTIPTVNVFRVWPVGTRIDEWDMPCCVAHVPSNLEYMPHRAN